MDPDTYEILTNVVFIAVLILSVVIHEVMHGWTADRMGDPTARQLGRITLNPLAHVDPFMTVIMPIATQLMFGFPFGGAKPVPVNPFNLTRRGSMLVSLAGPLSNIALAAASYLVLLLVHFFVPVNSLGFLVLFAGMFVNLLLAAFNLIPIPPLDGSHVLAYFIPALEEPFHRIGGAGLLVVIMIVSAGGFRIILKPLLAAMDVAIAWAYALGR